MNLAIFPVVELTCLPAAGGAGVCVGGPGGGRAQDGGPGQAVCRPGGSARRRPGDHGGGDAPETSCAKQTPTGRGQGGIRYVVVDFVLKFFINVL